MKIQPENQVAMVTLKLEGDRYEFQIAFKECEGDCTPI